jgi:phosphoribosylamine--glycine ligase
VVDDVDAGLAAIGGRYPVALKFDGLAAGKGVVLPRASRGAGGASRTSSCAGASAPAPVVVEEFLHGEELSLLAVCDGDAGRRARAPPRLQAHRRRRPGPEHGGHGLVLARWPAPGTRRDLRGGPPARLDELRRAASRSAARSTPGSCSPRTGPRVIEFNCRFGDPETQAVLPRLTSDLLALLTAASEPGGLAGAEPPSWREDWAVTVVLASAGYPESSRSGDVIHGLQDVPPGVEVTHAGTALDAAGRTVTAGGRVLNVTGLGPTPSAARDAAYAAADLITFEGRQLRTDIARAAAVEHGT